MLSETGDKNAQNWTAMKKYILGLVAEIMKQMS